MTTKTQKIAIIDLSATKTDPTVRRRELCIARLIDQQRLLADASYMKVTQRWSGKGTERKSHRASNCRSPVVDWDQRRSRSPAQVRLRQARFHGREHDGASRRDRLDHRGDQDRRARSAHHSGQEAQDGEKARRLEGEAAEHAGLGAERWYSLGHAPKEDRLNYDTILSEKARSSNRAFSLFGVLIDPVCRLNR
jgi:hypothetical protein